MKPSASSVPERWQEAVSHPAEMFPDENYMEHRWGTRRACNARVSICARGGIGGVGQLRNISISGAFLETVLPLPLYAQLDVAVAHADGSNHLLEFPAVVVRHEADGVGLEWCDPNPGRICQKLGCSTECAYQETCPA